MEIKSVIGLIRPPVIALSRSLARGSAQVGVAVPDKRCDAASGRLRATPKGAGVFWRMATSLVVNDAAASLPPCFLPRAKIRSVTAGRIKPVTL